MAPAGFSFSGQVDGKAGAGSIEMSAGELSIQHGAILGAADVGMKLTGGTLLTRRRGFGTQWAADISGDVANTGANVRILRDTTMRKPGSEFIFGELRITGKYDWTAGLFTPAILAPGGNVNMADRIKATGAVTATTGNNATVAPIAIDAAGASGTMNPVVGQRWIVLSSAVGITTTNPPAVAGKWKGNFPPAGNPPFLNWDVEGIP